MLLFTFNNSSRNVVTPETIYTASFCHLIGQRCSFVELSLLQYVSYFFTVVYKRVTYFSVKKNSILKSHVILLVLTCRQSVVLAVKQNEVFIKTNMNMVYERMRTQIPTKTQLHNHKLFCVPRDNE